MLLKTRKISAAETSAIIDNYLDNSSFLFFHKERFQKVPMRYSTVKKLEEKW